MKKLPWVKWEPESFLSGVAGLDAREIGVYSVVLNLIYDRGGPIPDDVERIGRRCGLRPTSCEKALASLSDAGKIIREDGQIRNPRAERELETREKVHATWVENFSGDGSKSKKKASKNKRAVAAGGEAGAPRARTVEEESVEKERKKDSMSSSPKAKTLNGINYSEEFETKVWQPYPRKKGTSKHKAYQLWQMLNEENQQRVIVAIPLYAEHMRRLQREESTIKHLEFFLSGRVYETYAPEAAGNSNVVAIPWHKTATREQWERTLKLYVSWNDWREAWGPPPGREGCGVPEDLIDTLPFHLHPKNDPALRSRNIAGSDKGSGAV